MPEGLPPGIREIQGTIAGMAIGLRDIRVKFKTTIQGTMAQRVGGLEVRAGMAMPTTQIDPYIREFVEQLQRLIPATKVTAESGFTTALVELGEIGVKAMQTKIRGRAYRGVERYIERKPRREMVPVYRWKGETEGGVGSGSFTGRALFGDPKPGSTYPPTVRLGKHKYQLSWERETVTRPRERERDIFTGEGYATGALHDSIGYKLQDPVRTGKEAELKGTGGYRMVLIGPEVAEPLDAHAYKSTHPRDKRTRARRTPKVYGKYVDGPRPSKHFPHPVQFRLAARRAIAAKFKKVMQSAWDAAWAGRVRGQIKPTGTYKR